MRNFEEARAYNKQEKSTETSELWSAILATHEALLALGGTGLPELHVNRAKANLIRAGEATSGDFTDDDLKQIAASDGTRVWSATMGTVFKDEPIVHDGSSTSASSSTGRRPGGPLAPSEAARCSACCGVSRKSPAYTWTSSGASTSRMGPSGVTPSTTTSTPPSRRQASRSMSPTTRTWSRRSTSSTKSLSLSRNPVPTLSRNPNPAPPLIGTIWRTITPSRWEITSPTMGLSTKSSGSSPSRRIGRPRPC